MNTHKDWKNYQFVDDGGMEIDDVELSDDESDQNQNQNLIQQKKKGKGGRPKGRQVCSVKKCRKTKWGRGMCYNHANKASKGIPIDDYSSDDDEIPTARPELRTIGTQTGTSTYDDVPLVSDNSGHYTASIASDSSSSSSARGLPKDDTTVDENSSSSGDNESDTNIQRNPIGCTPHINDVLLVAGHHSHMGNVQFCNAVSMCNTDFSVVPECFSDALKSLSPPGRFLVKSVSDGGWKEISHDLAPSIIPLIMDHHKLKSSHLYQRESLSFLSRVERKIESKYGGPCLNAKAPERSPTSPTASLPATTVTAPTPAVVAAPIANTKEAVTNRCIAQTLQTFNIWNDQNWRNNMLAGFGVDTTKMAQDGFLLNQLTSETLNQILEQSSLSAHTLLTLVFDAEVKSLVKSHDAMV